MDHDEEKRSTKWRCKQAVRYETLQGASLHVIASEYW